MGVGADSQRRVDNFGRGPAVQVLRLSVQTVLRVLETLWVPREEKRGQRLANVHRQALLRQEVGGRAGGALGAPRPKIFSKLSLVKVFVQCLHVGFELCLEKLL